MLVAVLVYEVLPVLLRQILHRRYALVDYEVNIVITRIDQLFIQYRCTLFILLALLLVEQHDVPVLQFLCILLRSCDPLLLFRTVVSVGVSDGQEHSVVDILTEVHGDIVMYEQSAVLILPLPEVEHIIDHVPFVLILVYDEELVLDVQLSGLFYIKLQTVCVQAASSRCRSAVAASESDLRRVLFHRHINADLIRIDDLSAARKSDQASAACHYFAVFFTDVSGDQSYPWFWFSVRLFHHLSSPSPMSSILIGVFHIMSVDEE